MEGSMLGETQETAPKPKSEAPNPKQIQNPKCQITTHEEVDSCSSIHRPVPSDKQSALDQCFATRQDCGHTSPMRERGNTRIPLLARRASVWRRRSAIILRMSDGNAPAIQVLIVDNDAPHAQTVAE